mmetsp:Transcript_28562/g.82662  ORF Transcript_28562/g.82662 Transcript_28562/m.82662 type:complete len:204 (-) Transcript_28562:797-1408(-)
MEGPFLSHSLSQQIFQVRVQVRVYHHPSSYSTPLSRCLSIWNTGKHIDGSLLTLGTAHVGVHIQDVYVRRHWTVERETDGPIVVHAAAFLRWMGAEGDLGHGDASAAGDLAAVLVSLAEDGLPMLKIEVVITLDAASCEPNPQSVGLGRIGEAVAKAGHYALDREADVLIGARCTEILVLCLDGKCGNNIVGAKDRVTCFDLL